MGVWPQQALLPGRIWHELEGVGKLLLLSSTAARHSFAIGKPVQNPDARHPLRTTVGTVWVCSQMQEASARENFLHE